MYDALQTLPSKHTSQPSYLISNRIYNKQIVINNRGRGKVLALLFPLPKNNLWTLDTPLLGNPSSFCNVPGDLENDLSLSNLPDICAITIFCNLGSRSFVQTTWIRPAILSNNN